MISLDSEAGPRRASLTMMPTPHLLRSGLLALATLTSAIAARDGWTADFDAAKKQATAEHKDLLLDFTGSDWCGWCIKLDKEVFQQDAFKTGIKDKLVLVDVDFPKDKSKLSEATQAQNEKLRDEFKIQGYPSIMLCDASGKPYAQIGYEKDGPAKYLSHLKSLMEVRNKRDAAFAAADKATEPVDKAKNLVAGLKTMDGELVENCYADVIAKITQLDKDDATGFVKEQKAATAKKVAAEAAMKGLQEFMQTKVMPLMQAKEFDKAYASALEYIKANPSLPEDTQIGIALNIGLARFVEKADADAANKFVDAIIAAHPAHTIAKQGDQIKQQIKEHIEKAAAQPAVAPKPE